MKKYKNTIIVFVAVFVCFLLFIAVSVFSLINMARENTKEINTMLTYQIYNEISDRLSEPITVSRAMCSDEFLIETMKREPEMSDEEAIPLMKEYLSKLKAEYGYDTTFVISDKTRRYFTFEGLNKIVDVENDAHDIWYKNFLAENQRYMIDVDLDEVNEKEWTVFTDFRLEDGDGNLLGVCGVGSRMANINKVFSQAQKNHNVRINFVDKTGLIQIDTDEDSIESGHIDMAALSPSVEGISVGVSPDGKELTVSKYIEPLDWYLIVRSDITEINTEFGGVIFLNVVICLVIALVVLIIVAVVLRHSETKSLFAENMGKQLAAAADIYISMHEINFLTDTLTVIKSSKAEGHAAIGDTHKNCQQTIREMMKLRSDPSTLDSILDFVDLTKLDDRLRKNSTVTSEFLNKDGEWRRARFIVSERNEEGNVARIMYLIEDIDAEKRARDKVLEDVEHMNEQISSVASIYFTMHDIDLTNDTFSEIKTNSAKVSELVGSNMEHAQDTLIDVTLKLAHKISHRAIKEFLNFSTLPERLESKNTLTEEFLSINEIWCRGRFVVSKRGPDGNPEHVIWLVEGIDEEKRRRDAISAEARSLTTQMASISNIYMTVFDIDLFDDSFSIIKSDNAAVNLQIRAQRSDAQRLMYRTMEQFTDSSSRDEVLSFVDFSTLNDRLRDINTVALEFITMNGKWVRVRFMSSQRTDNGRLSHVLWLAEDISAEKKERDRIIDMSERALAASEAKSSFLSNMSGGIRTPINELLGMNERILSECEDEKILAYSEGIQKAGSTLLGLVNDILDFSRIEAGKMEIVPADYDLSVLIVGLAGMIKPKAQEKNLSFELDINRNIPRFLYGDEQRIKQIIMNLLTNAVKYTEEGSVTLCMDFTVIPDEPENILLCVEVIDTGIGIRKEDLHKLFSKFELEEEGKSVDRAVGTGLGMNITKRLLEMMDSSIDVESIYGMGSKFSFELKQKIVRLEELGGSINASC